MEIFGAAEILAALGHDTRLAIFRLLVESGPRGMHASAIGDELEMAPATLSFHLAHLSRVGLIHGEKESRYIHYSADYDAMGDLIAFLIANCCQGDACLPRKATALNSLVKPRGQPKRTSSRAISHLPPSRTSLID